MEKDYWIGVLSQWYPKYAILDVDSVPIEFVNDIRAELGLNDSNSMLFSSESVNSYHIITKPVLNQKPPTLKRLQQSFFPFAKEKGFEIYPQEKRIVRLPFGMNQNPLDLHYQNVSDWKDFVYWFEKIDEYDITTVEKQQLSLDLNITSKSIVPNCNSCAEDLMQYGLHFPSTREQS